MSTITPDILAAELTAATPARNEQEQHLALTVYRLLSAGEPVDRQAVADRAGLTREQVDEMLGRWPGVSSDENQRIVGFHGLSIQPTPHRLTVEGRTLYAWCAWDTLFLPELLGRPAEIHSQCPTTHEPITLTVHGTDITNTNPAETVLSFLHRDEPFDANTITSFCRYIHFFATQAAADEWIAQHDGTFTISLAEGSEIARLVNRARYPHVFTP